ncbi:MFS transporter [Bacillus sp. FJAT-27231]|uniref:MFS transporter n=1 Tax=Bacillus sp. FJAT-27231 TaxID=1679168 RepID=UPI000670BD26|nr:MFS transporter [Bacillus sp. FJAT-27231]KMY55256.1 MFS transporter [Bacillus sp. FJAT-27231]
MKNSRTTLMIIALFTASLNLRPAINSISPLLETLRHYLGINASTASLLTSIPVLCMGIFSPTAAKLGNRLGIEKMLGGALILVGIGTFLRFFIHSAFFLLCTAFLTGIGAAVMGPLLSGFIKKHFPNQVPKMISVYSVAMTMGAALASGLAAPLQNSLHSWRAALAIWAVLAFIAIPLWWLFVLRGVERPKITAASKSLTMLPWKNPKAWLLTFSFGLSGIIFFSITAWLPPIIQGLGYGEGYAGNVLTTFAIAQIPANLALPFMIRRFPSRLLLLLFFSFVELVGFVMIYFSAFPWVAAIFLGIGAASLFSLNLLLPIDATANGQEAAAWSAMIQAAGYVISATGPILIGWIHDVTGGFLFSILGLILINLLCMAVQFFAVSGNRKKEIRTAA